MSTNLFDLSGKVALITGGSRGIGAATARLLGAAGYDVAVNYAGNKAAAIAVAADIEAAGQRAIAVQADISDRRRSGAALRNLRRAVGTAMKAA